MDNAARNEATVQFLVTADGDIKDLRIKNSTSNALDNELLRILKRMPKWKPALENGKRVDYSVTQLMKFYRSGGIWKIQLGD